MEPQIIDFYNEFPHSVNVIEKMNEELSEIQEKYNILKEDLCMNPEYGRPIVKYESEEAFENKKNELYKELKDEIYEFNGIVGERTIKKIFYKLIPNCNSVEIIYNPGLVNEHTRLTCSNWVHWKSVDILKYVYYPLKYLIKSNIESEEICENIYDIITSEIDKSMWYIVKYRCTCGKLVYYKMKPDIGCGTKCIECDFAELWEGLK
jgi:hypothetical protein